MDNFVIGQRLLCIRQPKHSIGNCDGIAGQTVTVTGIQHDGSPRIKFINRMGYESSWNFWHLHGSWDCLVPAEGWIPPPALTSRERVLAKCKMLEERYAARMNAKKEVSHGKSKNISIQAGEQISSGPCYIPWSFEP